MNKTPETEKHIDYLVDKYIPSSRTLQVNGVTLVVRDEVKCYIQRIQATPFTIKDLDQIEMDFIELSRNVYKNKRL